MRSVAAACALLALAACSNRPGYSLSLRPDDAPRVRDASYYDVLERYTQYRQHYDGLDHRFFFAATWQSWAFRQRRVVATAEFLGLTPEEHEALLARERDEAARYVDFFVGLYTADRDWNTLSAKDSIWRVELDLGDGRILLPTSIQRLVRPDANTQALYAYLTPFWYGYRIRFSGTDEAGAPLLRPGAPLRLRVTSAVGSVVGAWPVGPADLP